MRANIDNTDTYGSRTRSYLDAFTVSLQHQMSNFTLPELSSIEHGLVAALVSIREERSSRAQINKKLSPELLLCIFEHVLAAPSPSETVCDHQSRTLPDCRSLIAVTHVCRRWRTTALEYSTLWSSFTSSAGYKLAMPYSERARAVPLTVYAVVENHGYYPWTEKRTLLRLIPRVRTLHIHIACMHQLRLFEDILEQATPDHMPSVRIRFNTECEHYHGDQLRRPLFCGSDQSLRSLTLDYAEDWPLPGSRFSQLTELRLINRSTFTRRANVCTMLEMLSGMPVLETLLVRDANDGETELGHHSASETFPQIHLPRLRRLTVALWNASSTLYFTSKLSFPDDTIVHLAAFWTPGTMTRPTPYTGESYTQIVVLQAVDVLNSLSASNARSTIELGLFEPQDCDVSRLEAISEGLATVEVLRIESITQRRGHTHDLPLDRLIGYLPALTHLYLRDYRGNIIPRLAALLASTTPTVLCPTLTAITLSILAPRLLSADLQPLLSATELRAESGFPLSRLTICTPLHSGTHPNDVSLHNVHGLKWLSFCSRDLYYGGREERGDAVLRSTWTDYWPAELRIGYEDLWRACEDAGPDASMVVLKHVGKGYII